jgi:hypothetical protein
VKTRRESWNQKSNVHIEAIDIRVQYETARLRDCSPNSTPHHPKTSWSIVRQKASKSDFLAQNG